ncbi:MAG TPA: leucine-rich repeat protein [Candidatus Saccharimonadales bacterium]
MKITKNLSIGIVTLACVLLGGILESPGAFAATPPDSCFAISSGVISEYYANEGNNGANPACPTVVDIPSTISGQTVTAIGTSAFSAKSITAVTIPSSVTNIGTGAFIANSLTSVVIPDSVTTIGNSAFMFNQLTSLTLGNSVATIGSNAFSNGNQITTLTIPDSMLTIGDSAFTSNQITTLILGSSLNSIGSSAFASNQLTSLTMGSSLENIEPYAFANNQLSGSLVLPSSLIVLGDNAFAGNQLNVVTISDSVTSIGAGAFAQNNITSVTLGAGLTSLPQDIFSYNQLTSVAIPTSIANIDPTAFYLQFADITELSGGDFSSAMDIRYVRLYTADPSNPSNLQDAQTLYPESAFSSDVNGDGDQLDTISFGGHLINPAQMTVNYQNTNGTTLALSSVATGDDLADYLANSNESNDLSHYFRIGAIQGFTAPTIAGYTIVTPSSPHTATLAAADGQNVVTFVYSNPEGGDPSSDISVPRAPDAGVAGREQGPPILLIALAGAGLLLLAGVVSAHKRLFRSAMTR